MARNRRRPVTRGDLLHRWAAAMGTTYGAALDAHADTEIEQLRTTVEALEDVRARREGQRRSFARSQPTTTVRGETR